MENLETQAAEVIETPIVETPVPQPSKVEETINEEAKAKFIASLTEDDYLKFIEESETGMKAKDKLNTRFLQSYTGENGGQKRAIEKAIKETEERIRKELLPEETAESKRIRELEEWKSNQEKQTQKQGLYKIVTNKLAETKMAEAVTLTDFLVGDTEEETNVRIETFTKVFDSLVEERVQKIVKEKFEQSAKSPQPLINPIEKKEEVKELRNMTGNEKIKFLANQKK